MSNAVRARIQQITLELIQGDITQQNVDAIVNAANTSLLGGGGVDGAIHRAAGPGLINETRKLGGCDTGDAKITSGHRLPAKHVIHAVGPVYRHGDARVPELLASAYRRSLEIAAAHQLRSVAFPAVSTGVYGYPMHAAAQVALHTIHRFLTTSKESSSLELIRFVLFTPDAFTAFERALQDLISEVDDVIGSDAANPD